MSTSIRHMLMQLRDHIHVCVHRCMCLLTHSHRHTCNFTLVHSQHANCSLMCSPGYSFIHVTTPLSHTLSYVPALIFTHMHTRNSHTHTYLHALFSHLHRSLPDIQALACRCCHMPPPAGQALALDPPLHPMIQICFII